MILASATATIGWPDLRLGTFRLASCFMPLTTILIVALAAAGPGPDQARYRWGIVAGLVCSLGGDIFLMLPRDHFLAGLLCFLAAHACYLAAFTADSRFAARPLPFVLWSLVGAVALARVWPNLPAALRVPVVLYASFLLAMASQAASRAMFLRNPPAVAAAIGATFFVISDTLLALKRFGVAVPRSRLLVLSSYFVAQWLIALSNRPPSKPENEGGRVSGKP